MVICDASVMDLSSVKRAYGCQLQSAMWCGQRLVLASSSETAARSIQAIYRFQHDQTNRNDILRRHTTSNPRLDALHAGSVQISVRCWSMAGRACPDKTLHGLALSCVVTTKLVWNSGGPARRMADPARDLHWLGIINVMSQSVSQCEIQDIIILRSNVWMELPRAN
jgi:hypothetical protein